MKTIEEFDYINNLLYIYKNLLSDKQKNILTQYYEYNLSLSEIASNLKISRSGVNDALLHGKENLINYENILKIYQKQCEIFTILEKSEDIKDLKKEIKEVIK